MSRYLMAAALLIAAGSTIFLATRSTPAPEVARYYRFDATHIPSLQAFELCSDKLGGRHGVGTAFRSLVFESGDDQISIDIYRLLEAVPEESALKGMRKMISSTKTPVNLGDEAFEVGGTILVFRCQAYVCEIKGLSRHSRIAAGNYTGPIEELEERDFKVRPELDLRELGAEIASAIRSRSVELEPLQVLEFRPERPILPFGLIEPGSTFIDVATKSACSGNVAVFGAAEGLSVDYVDEQIRVRGNIRHPGWRTLHITVVNEALQKATASCRILSEDVGAIDSNTVTLNREESLLNQGPTVSQLRELWAIEAQRRGLRGKQAIAFFEAKYRDLYETRMAVAR